jgi:hypothetical protein
MLGSSITEGEMSETMKVVIVAGLFLLAATFVHGGRYAIVASSQNAAVWVVDRFTGDAYVSGTTMHYAKEAP